MDSCSAIFFLQVPRQVPGQVATQKSPHGCWMVPRHLEFSAVAATEAMGFDGSKCWDTTSQVRGVVKFRGVG